MATTTRSILVDDSDPDLDFTGPWVVNQGKDFDGVGTNGRVFGPTVRGVSAGASVAYTFEGTAGQIMGTSMINNRTGTLSPQWTCFIDGAQIQTEAITVVQNNNWPFCRWSGLSEGSHTVSLNVSSNGNPLYFDWLSYVPSTARTRPAGKAETVIIPSTDSSITYDDGTWSTLPDPLVGKVTSTTGASVTVSFTGNSIVWYAAAPSGTAIAQSKGKIRIDDRDTYPFSIPGLTSSASPSLFNQQYFQVANLSQGTHTLTVTYDGDSSMMPLTLTSVIVTDPPQQPPSKGAPIGIIVGGVVGGIVLIAFIALAVWYLMRKPTKPKPRPVEPQNIIQPFTVPPTTGPTSTTPSLRTVRSTATRQMTQDTRGPMSTASSSVSGALLPSNTSITSSNPSSQRSQPLLSPLSYRDRKIPISATSSTTRRGHVPQQPSISETNITSSSSTPSNDTSHAGRRRADSQRRRRQIDSTISEMPPAYTPG